MKRLYIVRHAKSSWKQPGLSDFERPLNPRGRKAAPEMGKRLKKRRVMPDRVFTSPAVRAAATARAVCEKLGYREDRIAEDERIYDADVGTLLDVVRATADDAASLMIFGHNPGSTELAELLTGEAIGNLPTCAVYAVDVGVDAWAEVGPGAGTCAFYDYPKKGD